MISHKDLEEFILNLKGTKLEHTFGDEVAVYKFSSWGIADGGWENKEKPDYKMFALIQEGSEPVRLSLKCDPKLAQTLREQYETVQPGFHLNKKHWNTIVCSGQLSESELHDLIRHSYQLVGGKVI
jgi:predicted DNA-binding protein (MmcQ/YjbR family)